MSSHRSTPSAITDSAVDGSLPSQRSWTDVLLISIWVVGYAVILTVFRFIKTLETMLRWKADTLANPCSKHGS
jgi:hypothetical protein